jgi:protein gp37
MANVTAIEWTDLSWNRLHGCSIASTECKNCYAMAISQRFHQTPKPWLPKYAEENIILKPQKLMEPLTNKKEWRGLGGAAELAGMKDGKLVFVNSMSDEFHPQVPVEFIARGFAVMAVASKHGFQVLTKRPERMAAILNDSEWPTLVREQARQMLAENRWPEHARARVVAWDQWVEWPLRNVWLGVSCGLRNFVGRLDHLRATPAAIRFVSAEPLLGSLVPELNLDGIDWLIAGGESGPHARPCETQWLRELRDACEMSGSHYFLKQLGGRQDKRGHEKAVLDGERYLAMPRALEQGPAQLTLA